VESLSGLHEYLATQMGKVQALDEQPVTKNPSLVASW